MSVDWWALLAPSPHVGPLAGVVLQPHAAARVLDRSYQLGEIMLRPADEQLVEQVPTRSAGGWATLVSWPIFVQGETALAGNVWSSMEQVRPLVHLGACLLSLTWMEVWEERITPTPTVSIQPQLPLRVPLPMHQDFNPQVGMRAVERLPEWVTPAWTRFSKAPPGDRLLRSLTIWHQGMLLFALHPSMALIAFVAAIEVVAASGELREDLPRQVVGAKARFWAALQLVVKEGEFRELSEIDVYKLRSATGHGGKIHGFERGYGTLLTLPLSDDDEAGRFVAKIVRRVARAGRELLIRCIAAGEPR